jgi:hypothetical protein
MNWHDCWPCPNGKSKNTLPISFDPSRAILCGGSSWSPRAANSVGSSSESAED